MTAKDLAQILGQKYQQKNNEEKEEKYVLNITGHGAGWP